MNTLSRFTGTIGGRSGRQGARRVEINGNGFGKVLFDNYPAIFSYAGPEVDALTIADALSQAGRFSDVTRYNTRGAQKSPAELAFVNDIHVAPYPIELFSLDYDLITPTSGAMSYQGLSYFTRDFFDRVGHRVDERHLYKVPTTYAKPAGP